MTSIVFSKNRAVQLNAFLRSYRDHLIPLGTIDVSYCATTPAHRAAYDEVFATHDFAVPHHQTALKQNILDVLPETGCVIFYVDDQVFLRPWRVEERPGLSLRLAPHLTHCYNAGVRQALPEFRREGLELLSWQWGKGKVGWHYPLSLDGHIFDVEEMCGFIAQIEFHSPNTFEAALQRFTHLFADRWGYCYPESKVVNVPWNIVQTDWPNRHSGAMSADELLSRWQDGFEIDVQALYGSVNRSVHQIYPLALVPR